jgi:hypothetical protein
LPEKYLKMLKSKTGTSSQQATSSNKIGSPTPDGTDIISRGTEYFRISKAAEILRCTADDLLHMGATGNAEIMAAVLAKGYFEWPVDGDGLGFPEVDEPFVVEFDGKDRVILSDKDLANIEGKGWTIPRFFYSPTKAREVIKNAPVSLSEALENEEERKRLIKLKIDDYSKTYEAQIADKFDLDNEADIEKASSSRAGFESYKASLSEPSGLTSSQIAIREYAFYAAWYPVDELEPDAEKTTIDHLFISKKELLRLKNGLPQDDAVLKRNKKILEQTLQSKIHGNTEVNASIRESILKAAIYCMYNYPEKCKKDNVSWAKVIDEKAPIFWQDGEPPRSKSTIERLLGEALKAPSDVKK